MFRNFHDAVVDIVKERKMGDHDPSLSYRFSRLIYKYEIIDGVVYTVERYSKQYKTAGYNSGSEIGIYVITERKLFGKETQFEYTRLTEEQVENHQDNEDLLKCPLLFFGLSPCKSRAWRDACISYQNDKKAHHFLSKAEAVSLN